MLLGNLRSCTFAYPSALRLELYPGPPCDTQTTREVPDEPQLRVSCVSAHTCSWQWNYYVSGLAVVVVLSSYIMDRRVPTSPRILDDLRLMYRLAQ